MFGGGEDQEDDDDAKLLQLIAEPHVTKTIRFPEPEDVGRFRERLADANKLTFNAVLSEPLGAYTLGARSRPGRLGVFPRASAHPTTARATLDRALCWFLPPPLLANATLLLSATICCSFVLIMQAFMEGKTDLFKQQPKTVKTSADFVGVFTGRTQYTNNSVQMAREKANK